MSKQVTPPATNDPNAIVNALGGLGGSSNSKFGAVDLSNSTFSVLGLGIPSKFLPKGKTDLTADEIDTAFRQIAQTNPDVWAGIQQAMYLIRTYNSNALPDLGVYKYADTGAVKNLLENMTVLGGSKPVSLPLATYLTTQENNAKTLGGSSTRNTIAKVSVPNSQDLSVVLQNAFKTALGHEPTDDEQKRFASAYQSSVLQNAQDNLTTSIAAKGPVAPTDNSNGAPVPGTGQYNGSTLVPAQYPVPTLASNYSDAQKGLASTTSLAPQQQVASPDVAAQNFALKSDPTGAASNGLNDAMNNWFSTLSRGGGK